MAGKDAADPKLEANRMAALCIAWGVVAAVAYFGLLTIAVDYLAKTTGLIDPKLLQEHGILTLQTGKHTFSTSDPLGTLFAISVPAIPVATLAVLALGIFGRIKRNTAVGGVVVAGAVVGFLGALSLFLSQVVNNQAQRTEFLVALSTIILVAILLWLQKRIRGFWKSNPAAVSILLTVVVLIYVFLSNNISLSGVILQNVDIWLALIAFAFAFYGGVRYIRNVRKAS